VSFKLKVTIFTVCLFFTSSIILFGQGCGVGFKTYLTTESSSKALSIDHPDINPPQKTSESKILLMDRLQLESFLTEIFGNSIKPIIDANIRYSFEAFGLPCDPYSQNGVNDCLNTKMNIYPNETNFATAIAYSTYSTDGNINSVREGLRMNVCDQIIQNDISLSFALSKLSASLNSAPTVANLRQIVELFFPFADNNEDLVQVLSRNIFTNDFNNLSSPNKWRVIFLTLCYSPDWQVL